jgi:adenosylmethionine-8-amino-7-oxononanoate aminotransferase
LLASTAELSSQELVVVGHWHPEVEEAAEQESNGMTHQDLVPHWNKPLAALASLLEVRAVGQEALLK